MRTEPKNGMRGAGRCFFTDLRDELALAKSETPKILYRTRASNSKPLLLPFSDLMVSIGLLAESARWLEPIAFGVTGPTAERGVEHRQVDSR